MDSVLSRLRSALSDRYRIERELGSGGMATVHLAHDLKHKIYDPLRSEPRFIALMKRLNFVK